MLVVDSSSSSSHLKEKIRQIPSCRRACFSFAAYAKNVINHMRMCHIPILEGLCDEEFSKIEGAFGFTFPPDLRSILQEGLPTGEGFPQWRVGSHAEIRSLLELPIAALCREVSRGRFWCPEWGTQPAQLDEALRVAAHALRRVPTLVPIYGNCYISCFPVQAGNPIFLVQETTILYCGYDISDFFKRQAFVPRQSGGELHRLQSQLVRGNGHKERADNQLINRKRWDNQGVVMTACGSLNNQGVKSNRGDNQGVKTACGSLNNQGVKSNSGDNQGVKTAWGSLNNQGVKSNRGDDQGVKTAWGSLNNQGVKSNRGDDQGVMTACRKVNNQGVKANCGDNQGVESISGDNYHWKSGGKCGDIHKRGENDGTYSSSKVGTASNEEFLGADKQGIKVEGTCLDKGLKIKGRCIDEGIKTELGGHNQGVMADDKKGIMGNEKESVAMWRWADESPRTPELHGADGGSSSKESPKLKKDDVIMATERRVAISKKYLYFYEKPLPSRMLTKFTMAAPPWAAKQARRIDFWSDVAETYRRIPTSCSSAAATPPLHVPAGHGSTDHYNTVAAHKNKATLQQPFGAAGCINIGKAPNNVSWLSSYLDGLADALRKGRWSEADIADMLRGESSNFAFNNTVDQAGIQSWLKQAGWSDQDTLQMLSS